MRARAFFPTDRYRHVSVDSMARAKKHLLADEGSGKVVPRYGRKMIDDSLKRHVQTLRKAIQEKYHRFRNGEVTETRDLEKLYKPILTELRKKSPQTDVKEENMDTGEVETMKKEDEDMDVKEEETERPRKRRRVEVVRSFRPQKFSSPRGPQRSLEELLRDNDGSNVEDTMMSIQAPTDSNTTASGMINAFEHALTRKYMTKMMKEPTGTGRYTQIDHVYGPRYEGDVLMIGDQRLMFDNDGSIRIRDTTYAPTEGLYELVFKRSPNEYSTSDLNAYKDILRRSNAHRKGYTSSGHVNRNASSKYKQIIETLFPKQPPTSTTSVAATSSPATKTGRGLLTKSLTGPRVLYWDSPDELVSRLKLLVASAQAGNTSVRNEILSIVEELREAKIISGIGNSMFRALVK